MGADDGGPILVVEADRRLGQAIAEELAADGFSVELARTAEHARMLARTNAPRLAVLGLLDSPRGALAPARMRACSAVRASSTLKPSARSCSAIVRPTRGSASTTRIGASRAGLSTARPRAG